MTLLNDRKRDDWKGLSFDDPCKAVIANNGRAGCVLWTVGAHIRFEMEECGFSQLGDLGLDDAPDGISIWEGIYVWQSGGFEYPHDGEMYPAGKFRKPSKEEWDKIIKNECPWSNESSIDVLLDGLEEEVFNI